MWKRASSRTSSSSGGRGGAATINKPSFAYHTPAAGGVLGAGRDSYHHSSKLQDIYCKSVLFFVVLRRRTAARCRPPPDNDMSSVATTAGYRRATGCCCLLGPGGALLLLRRRPVVAVAADECLCRPSRLGRLLLPGLLRLRPPPRCSSARSSSETPFSQQPRRAPCRSVGLRINQQHATPPPDHWYENRSTVIRANSPKSTPSFHCSTPMSAADLPAGAS